MEFKYAFKEAVEAMEVVPVQKIHHKNIVFGSPNRWIICLLGTLKNICNFDWVKSDPSVNIMIVCITKETDPIDSEQLETLKQLVSRTNEGALMIFRETQANYLDKELMRVRNAISSFPCKRIPLIQEQIRF